MSAALYCSIPHGGWCPKGRKSEDGKIPDRYQLQETTTADYLTRTEANVVDSDATLVFTYGRPSGGSLRTIEFARKHGKPWHHIDLKVLGRKRAVKEIVQWLKGEIEDDQPRPPTSCVLNVAGQRESKSPRIEDAVLRIVVDVLIEANPECKRMYPLPDGETVSADSEDTETGNSSGILDQRAIHRATKG